MISRNKASSLWVSLVLSLILIVLPMVAELVLPSQKVRSEMTKNTKPTNKNNCGVRQGNKTTEKQTVKGVKTYIGQGVKNGSIPPLTPVMVLVVSRIVGGFDCCPDVDCNPTCTSPNRLIAHCVGADKQCSKQVTIMGLVNRL